MATKGAKGDQGGDRRTCPDCGAELRVVRYAGYGPKGLFWVCEKNCGFMQRTG